MNSRDMPTALETVILSIVLLAGLQAVRNIVAIPLQIALDSDSSVSPEVVDDWFAVPTYMQSTVF
jgi:hypothetical protein